LQPAGWIGNDRDMMSADDNARLTRVGPGTPMGRLLREYWIPTLLSTELPVPRCAPVRVMLLGERLIAFRDDHGAVGLVAEACPHRGASLFLGRCTERGLRCAYHGWTFDTSGRCTDAPTEPPDSTFQHKVRASAYPCRERGGLVWAYLGPRATPPSLPDLEPNLDELAGRADATLSNCNWLQSLEGDLDLPHVPHLHTAHVGTLAKLASLDAAPPPPDPLVTFDVADTAAGFAFAGAPTPRKGRRVWSVGHFMFPFFANLPFGPLGSHWAVARVPMDDHHTMTFGMWNRDAVVAPRELMFGRGAIVRAQHDGLVREIPSDT
jgi:phthalate 4,5-dioxygenase oxygenase subunit